MAQDEKYSDFRQVYVTPLDGLACVFDDNGNKEPHSNLLNKLTNTTYHTNTNIQNVRKLNVVGGG